MPPRSKISAELFSASPPSLESHSSPFNLDHSLDSCCIEPGIQRIERGPDHRYGKMRFDHLRDIGCDNRHRIGAANAEPRQCRCEPDTTVKKLCVSRRQLRPPFRRMLRHRKAGTVPFGPGDGKRDFEQAIERLAAFDLPAPKDPLIQLSAHSKWTASQTVGCCGSVHSTRWRFLAGMKT